MQIVSYIRNEKNEPYGVFVSNGRDKMGMSFCHPDDEFVKVTARALAIERIVDVDECIDILLDKREDYMGKNPHITDEVVVRALFFKRRIRKYFKEEA